MGFLLITFAAYEFSFSKTFEMKAELEDLRTQLQQSSMRSRNKADIIAKEVYLDSMINKNRAGGFSLQNDLLKTLNHYSEEYSYKIISFKKPHLQVVRDSTEISSFQFVLEGEYKNLEKILYTLERDYSFGSFSHIGFKKEKDYRINKSYLQCEVVVQNVR